MNSTIYNSIIYVVGNFHCRGVYDTVRYIYDDCITVSRRALTDFPLPGSCVGLALISYVSLAIVSTIGQVPTTKVLLLVRVLECRFCPSFIWYVVSYLTHETIVNYRFSCIINNAFFVPFRTVLCIPSNIAYRAFLASIWFEIRRRKSTLKVLRYSCFLHFRRRGNHVCRCLPALALTLFCRTSTFYLITSPHLIHTYQVFISASNHR